MRRILVVGGGGAGKSTFARQLGERLGLPVTHMDVAFWRPGWQQPATEEWETQVDELISRDAWVMDGSHRHSLRQALARADMVVLLDLGRARRVWRVLWRWLRHRRRPRPELPFPDRLSLAFLRETWDYPRSIRPGVLALVRGSGVPVVRLRTPREVVQWLATSSTG